jgi:hypothetical protein
MTDPTAKPRRYRLTPDRCVLGLLGLEALLLLSQWFRWFPFNEHKGWTVLICLATVGAALLLMSVWFLAALVFRLRFQFSILSLLLLVVVVAVPCKWLATELNKAREQKAEVEEIRKLGGGVAYDYQAGPQTATKKLPAPAWLCRLLGDDPFANVMMAFLADSTISDIGLEHLKGLTQLHGLYLGGTKVTGKGVKRLQQALPNCQSR